MTHISKNTLPEEKNDRPTQYVKGYTEFYKLRFLVTEDALIPRPETELLVDEVLKFLPSQKLTTVLDIGTGAGNISVSIAKNNTDVNIIATDVSESALEIAKKNASLHGVTDRIEFISSNLLENVPRDKIPADNKLIVVTNLPYIPTERIDYLDSSVKDFEPRVALDGGHDGFELYRKLFQEIKKKNLKPSLIVGEIDYTHGELAVSESQLFFPDCMIEVKLDLHHKQRILLIFRT